MQSPTTTGVAAKPDWRRIILACMADYLDAGAIVAASIGLAVWQGSFSLDNFALGLLAGLGVNSGSYAIGSLVGGRLGDLVGRKRIYKWDLLLYAVGGLLVVFAANGGMLLAGLIVMGLAVGADVPASWALIGEIAPQRSRGRFMGLTSVFWSLGPLVSLLLGVALAPWGMWGIRIIFAQLVVAALLTWFLRRRMTESEVWTKANASAGVTQQRSLRELFKPPYTRRLLLVFSVHTLGSIAAGTFGFFLPYILRTVGAESQAASAGFNALHWALGALGVIFLFMPLVDRVNRRWMFCVAGAFEIASMMMMIFLPLSSSVVVIVFVVVHAIAGSCGQEQLYRVWCQELFPTMLRATAQGGIIFLQKGVLAVWSLFVPVVLGWSFSGFVWVLTVTMIIAVVIGTVFMPKKPASIEQVA